MSGRRNRPYAAAITVDTAVSVGGNNIMHKYAAPCVAAGLCLFGSAPSQSATLDDVMSELKSLRHENAAIRGELATLRRRETVGRSASPAPVSRSATPEARVAVPPSYVPAGSGFAGGVSPRSIARPLDRSTAMRFTTGAASMPAPTSAMRRVNRF